MVAYPNASTHPQHLSLLLDVSASVPPIQYCKWSHGRWSIGDLCCLGNPVSMHLMRRKHVVNSNVKRVC